MKYTPENIVQLEKNEIFVYGANEAFIHGAGAARTALKWGAKIGKIGLQGQTYGLPTKDAYIETLPLDKILEYVKDFHAITNKLPQFTFLVTKIGCGLAGYSVKEIAKLFGQFKWKENVIFPLEFHEYLN